MEIREFQKLIKDLYQEWDEKRGVDHSYMWLVEEVGELSEAIRKKDRESIKEELADVVAWSATIANLLDMDLEELLKKKYPGKCTYCDSNPCACAR
ncbi:MAG: MazG nucleotide pyrophosphohydrolase domain-containing protein [archaeon]